MNRRSQLVVLADRSMAFPADPSYFENTTSTLEVRIDGLDLEDNEEWELKEGIPQFSDPFIQKC